jgi:hypothetical protein
MSSALWRVTNGRAAAPPAILHHRRLDFQIPALVEEAAQERDDLRPALEDAARLGIDDEIHVSAPVPLLEILESVPLVRQRPERLGEELESFRLDRELPRPRPEDRSFDADPVPQVQELVEPEAGLPHDVPLDVDLDLGSAVREIEECRLPGAARRAPPGGRDALRVRLEKRGVVGAVGGDDLRDGPGRTEEVRIAGVPAGDDRFEAAPAVRISSLSVASPPRRHPVLVFVHGRSHSSAAAME